MAGAAACATAIVAPIHSAPVIPDPPRYSYWVLVRCMSGAMGRWRPRMAPPRPGAMGATTARSSRAWSYPCLSRPPPGRQPPSPSRPVLVPVPEPDPTSRPDSDADTASSSFELPPISPSSLPQELVTLEQQPLLQGEDRGHAAGLPRHQHRRALLASAHPGRRNPSTGTLVCLPHHQTGSRVPVNH